MSKIQDCFLIKHKARLTVNNLQEPHAMPSIFGFSCVRSNIGEKRGIILSCVIKRKRKRIKGLRKRRRRQGRKKRSGRKGPKSNMFAKKGMVRRRKSLRPLHTSFPI
ncbi:uncharacterized protein LOC117178444 [Belonocnema kinseyi]|uniref:uncharacterized protein LOC117178444 n=1 Tax=Belonocnema kinseyi TaxID=2817044 RepID=UPI00143DB7BA|nr:uncharacterized protein LOC117178444 [Belonocnema kinseyi]